jgi:hypothetical protein
MDTFSDPQGPIEEFSWGKFVILGNVHSDQGEGVGKDIRMVGDRVTEWKERKGHILLPEMITGVFEPVVECLVIGIGVDSAIKVSFETKQYMHDRGINQLILLPTPEACKKYNILVREGQKAGLLAHGTC